MIANAPWELQFDSLAPTRPLNRAKLLLGLNRESVVVLLDADTDEFVKFPDLPPDWLLQPYSLSADGRHLVFFAREHTVPRRTITLCTLATGVQREFDASRGETDVAAALSPNGRTLATMAVSLRADDVASAVINLIDVDTRVRTVLWSHQGYPATPAAGPSWSPDGRMLAATYMSPEEIPITVVIDIADRTVAASYDEFGILGSANGAWVSERELLLVSDSGEDFVPPLFVANVDTSTTRRFDRVPELAGGPLAVLGGGLVQVIHHPDRPDLTNVYTSELDGTDSRRLLTLDGAHINVFDVAPLAMS